MDRAAHTPLTSPAVGDVTALYARERLAMLRLATLMVGSVEVAEEVVQDAFVAVEERWDHLERPGGYLRTSVVNGCRMVLRRREVERRHDEAVGRARPAVQDGPDRLVELADALDRLSERQRAVVVLRYFVDQSDVEIAVTLGCRPSTVRSLARRALLVMREELR